MSLQTGVIDLVEAKVSPRQFQNLRFSHQTQELAFLLLPVHHGYNFLCCFHILLTNSSSMVKVIVINVVTVCSHTSGNLTASLKSASSIHQLKLPCYLPSSPCDSYEFIVYCCYSITTDFDFNSLPLRLTMLIFMQLEL